MNPLHASVFSVLLAVVPALAQEQALPADGDGAAAALAASPRHGESVDVPFDDGAPIVSYVVYPERPDKAPVVIVIHEIFGQSDWIRGVADQLAAEGFIAIAPDMLSGMGPDDGGTDSFPEGQVRQAIRQLDDDAVEDRLDAVREYAVALPAASGTTGVVGFCWGGSQSFAYATEVDADEVQAAVVYYGTAPDDDLDEIEIPVLGLYGSDDTRVTSTVEPTAKAMTDAGKSYEPVIYDGAGHGFLRQQSARDGANAKAAQAAWTRTIAFFKEHLETAADGD